MTIQPVTSTAGTSGLAGLLGDLAEAFGLAEIYAFGSRAAEIKSQTDGTVQWVSENPDRTDDTL